MTRNTRKTDPRAVHDGRDDLLESAELLRDARLEIERELDLGKSGHKAFPAVSVSGASASGSLLRCENIGTEISASHLAISRMLDSRPIDGIEQRAVLQPLGESLLAEGRAVQELTDAVREGGLCATPLRDGSLECSNVRFIHNYTRYTTRVVDVNNPGRVPADNHSCIVLKMPEKKPKPAFNAPKPRRRSTERPPVSRGADGLTLGERVKKCMDARSRALGRDYGQTELVADASRIVGQDPDTDPIITQQALSKILRNKTEVSKGTVAFAKVFGVESMWLQYGIGPATYLDTALKEK